jgi:hypothetical protein
MKWITDYPLLRAINGKLEQYLRQGSVTTYAIEAPYKDMQPTNVMEERSNTPRRRLPSPPSNSSFRDLMAESALSVELLSPDSSSDCKPAWTRRLRESKSTTTRAISTSSKKKKSVTFDWIKVNEFPMVLGDNPSVSSGVPIMLGWKSQNELKVNIDIYERFYRSQVRRSRRHGLAIPVRQRTKLLIQSGYSIYEIADATLKVVHIKKERAETLEGQGWERVNMFMESASRAVRTVIDAKPAFVGAKTA